jgi:hypothetical protein
MSTDSATYIGVVTRVVESAAQRTTAFYTGEASTTEA